VCRAGPDEQTVRSKFSARGTFSEKTSIQMINLIARFRLIAMKGKPQNQKERKKHEFTD